MKKLAKQEGGITLKFVEVAPEVYSALHNLKRTGWVDNGVKNPESVKEHTEALVRLAYELSPELSEEEKSGLVEMLEVHDWPEAIVGDEVILELRPDERKVLKENKFEREKAAMNKLCQDLPIGAEIFNLWIRHETSRDPAASFSRQLDKYQAVEKALYYEQTQGIKLFTEFLQYSINFINHPLLRAKIAVLQDKYNHGPVS